MSSSKCRPTPCSLFFQQKEFMNIENFYNLKLAEWQAHREHEAAIRIQSFFRAWMIRKNFKLLNDAAIKIQSLIRGFLARSRVDKLLQELEEQKLDDDRKNAAIKIQSYWRGHNSRKNSFDYHKYKHVQDKNKDFTRRVRAINELESLATNSTNFEQSPTPIDMNKIFNKLINCDDFHQDILKLSPSRICQLVDYIEKMNQDCVKKGGRPAVKSLRLAQNLEAACGRRSRKDSLDHLFPEIPDIEGIVKPDKEKAALLKEAIRKLRSNIETERENSLAKKHHLLRTFQQPGVLSDICTHELTPMEKKLKALKFYRGPKLVSNLQSEQEQESQEKYHNYQVENVVFNDDHHFYKVKTNNVCVEDNELEEMCQEFNPWA